MINVGSKRCSHYLCTKHPSFNVEGSRTAAFCKSHAHDGMVDVPRKRCSHDFCTMKPSFCMEGSRTALYCIQHAGDHMVDVVNKRRSHNSCTKFTSFNVEGKKLRGILQETRSKRHGKRPYQAFINYFPESSAWTGCTTQRRDIRKHHAQYRLDGQVEDPRSKAIKMYQTASPPLRSRPSEAGAR